MLHLQQPPLSLSGHGHLGLVTAPFAASEQPLLCGNSLETNLSGLDARKAPSAKCAFLEGAPDPFLPFLSWVYDRAPTVPAVWTPHQADFPFVSPAFKEWDCSDPCAKHLTRGLACLRALQSPSRLARASLPLQPGSTRKDGISFSFSLVGC